MSLPHIQLHPEVKSLLAKSFCQNKSEDADVNEKFVSLLKWLGVPPAYTTLRMNTRCCPVDNIIQQLDSVLQQQCRERKMEVFEMFQHPALKDCVVISNRGDNTMLQPVEKEVIVDFLCGMSVLRGADVFIQGIMGAPTSMQKGDMVSVYSDVDGLCRKGFTQTFRDNKVFVGNGITQISREDLFCSAKSLSGVGITMTQPLYEAPVLTDVLPNLVFAQNLPSIVCSHVLDPQPGEIILDMCAAPGGKTIHIATLMDNRGRVVAFDKTSQKVQKVLDNASRWGVTCVQAYCFDARKAVDISADVSGAPPYPRATFDRILLDAPCSALGQRPASRNRLKVNDLLSYPRYQRKLFYSAVELLRPGGVLVYSTCTVTLDENEGQVAWALETFPCLSLVKQKMHLGGPGFPGSDLKKDDLHLVQRFDPSALSLSETATCDTDTIGFFIAKFIKK
ncbi:tRNA (cytosine(72)-C(5))-methyltransferase NSUN6-like [Gigantopelta aegis]|uniref:tRNA (cytosine(72)-C(5))-methyltransferase NSUN6-like n=1 Tax=Gigantopelta aegis TaxID=1735272 RepID=UPI001B8892E7|nr:tRNA (cytosine(72)-C(5))-methyltransferase NSUN6-like [Gigantopelta aegis]